MRLKKPLSKTKGVLFMKTYIDFKKVTKTYSNGTQSFTALQNIDLSINEGEFVIIKGKSGSGKSTLLNMLSGIDSPTSGKIHINNISIDALSSNELASWRGVHVGVVFQFFQLMPTLTVLENIMLPMELNNAYPLTQRKERALELLNRVDLEALSNKFPNTLSGGEKQRVAIARALANNPQIIIADEPTGNLDSHNTQIIHDILGDLWEAGKTILYVTHEKEFTLLGAKHIDLADGKVV